MEVVGQEVKLLAVTPEAEGLIEQAARTCYRSDMSPTVVDRGKFIQSIIKRGHESVLEHASATFLIQTDRGISHEIVRHRLASYSQESTRYCAYNGNIEVVMPHGFDGLDEDDEPRATWFDAVQEVDAAYQAMLNMGVLPQHARDVLPMCLATRIVMTANFREWRHFIKLRAAEAAHPKVRDIAHKIASDLYSIAPYVFADVSTTRWKE